MCGFAGEFLFAPGRADLARAVRMAETLRHRGPDEAGSYLSPDGRCAIGFRRLSVIDPSGSHQPMVSPDGRYVVAFNGEIYNFRQLRRELAGAGARFVTAGDTEVLLHLYARHGLEMLAKLDGMFALALLDVQAGRLLLARDRFGQKPLWYAVLADRVVFASQARALLAHGDVPRERDNESICVYITTGYVPAPRSLWKAVRKLPPACWALLGDGPAEPQPYWTPTPQAAPNSPRDAVEAIRASLQHAVESHMVSDVPLGALLSGGVDSSIVVALMARAAGRAGGVRTFTAGFADRLYDERPAAAAVAKHCGTDHTELLIEPRPAEALDAMAGLYDEPLADSSALPTWLICRAARQHVTVALAGDGGDEAFAGYDRYRAMRLAETMSPPKYFAVRAAALLLRPFASHEERSGLRRLVRFADGLPQPYAEQYLTYRCLFGSADLLRLFSDSFASTCDLDGPARWFCRLYEEADCDDEVTRAQRHDMLTYLPDDLLVKTDIASMASSLELRAPFLDHRVAALGLGLPMELKISGRRGKAALRMAFADLLPAGTFNRPKRGFGVPLGRWLREELRPAMEETLLDRSFLECGIFRPEAVVGLVNDHLARRGDHRHRLWALMLLARWLAANK
ncbi:MAG TPA: asparagine synthase (glutamine-hydrolyzing) [Phycisphaerales bacterium]|nr:asparagine synthase (glutamine-hydrolyzing) [Phycisphaerales bacterium]